MGCRVKRKKRKGLKCVERRKSEKQESRRGGGGELMKQKAGLFLL